MVVVALGEPGVPVVCLRSGRKRSERPEREAEGGE